MSAELAIERARAKAQQVAEGRLLLELEPRTSEMSLDDGLKIARFGKGVIGHTC